VPQPCGFQGAVVEVAFIVRFALTEKKPFTHHNSRSMFNFDRSLQII